MAFSEAEELFAILCNEDTDIPSYEREYRFHPIRKWRFDFAWPDYKIGVEIEGGVWGHGRHNRAKGFIDDCVKYNTAAILGWFVLRFPTAWVTQSVEAITMTKQLFETVERLRFEELGDI